MTNKSKQKGTSWESAIVNYLEDNGFSARRRVLGGVNDLGDIALDSFPAFTIEAKNERTLKLSEWVAEAEREAGNLAKKRGAASGCIGVVWAHKKGKSSPGEGYVIMTGDTFIRVLGILER